MGSLFVLAFECVRGNRGNVNACLSLKSLKVYRVVFFVLFAVRVGLSCCCFISLIHFIDHVEKAEFEQSKQTNKPEQPNKTNKKTNRQTNAKHKNASTPFFVFVFRLATSL